MSAVGDPALMQRANGVIEEATRWLARELPGTLDECVSVGLLGSCARGDISLVSDVDYCLAFAPSVAASRDLQGLVETLSRHIVTAFPQEPFAQRFSVFWSTIDDLRSGRCAVGRWPKYDRGAFRAEGKHIAGCSIPRESMPAVSAHELRLDSLQFLLTEVRPRLEAVRFFEEVAAFSGEQLQRLGPVFVAKFALMPVRLLYVLLPESEAQPFVSPETASNLCAGRYGYRPWWRLVEGGRRWRRAGALDVEEWADAAALIRMFGRMLYVRCLEQYLAVAARAGERDAESALRDWVSRLKQPE